MSTSSLYKKCRITAIIQETANCKSFLLEPLGEWQPENKSGQFLTLVFETKHGEKRRSYSISSAVDEPLKITVKKIDNGEFSRLLNYHAKVGDVLITTGFAGQFVLPSDDDLYKQFFFICAGSGIVPCFSLLKTLLSKTTKEVFLIYSNKSIADCIFYGELQRLQEEHKDKFRIKFLFSDVANIYESRLSNWLLPQFLNAWQHGSTAASLYYVCGPFDYMRMVEITLLSRVTRAQIIKENFYNWPRLILPEPPDSDPHQVTLKFDEHVYKLTVQYPENILKVAKRHNIKLPFSCEAGRCAACVASCTQGQVWMAYNEVLTEKEVAQGRVLICQGYPVGGDAVIEI